MNVLVTGGTGVVGVATVTALLRAGHKVRLLSRHADDDSQSFPDGVEPIAASVTSPGELLAAVAGCDCIVHIAGIVEEDPPESTFEAVNVGGTRHLITAAKSANQPYFIYISSLGADRGQSAYQKSKHRAEEIVRAYHGPWVILRPSSVYGPGDETVSTLLKMIRTLPAVPMVGTGDQPFQPLWHDDFGAAIEQVVSRRELAGRTLDLAGPEVTTTGDLLQRLATVTGRNVPRLAVPVWVTEVGVQMLEAFGSTGRKLLEQAGIGAPLNSGKLEMLLEENVIPTGKENALREFVPEPTPLEDGLEMLADMQPEQLPGDGVGAIQQTTYSAEIQGSSLNAASLLNRVCDEIHAVMPIEFAAEPGSPHAAAKGGTLTAAIFARGNVQVKLEEKTETRATFVTLEGHPIAGVMQLHAEELPGGGVRFNVHIASQPANVVDWLALHAFGGSMQQTNWRAVVRRVVKLSGGTAPGGVRQEAHRMTDEEARDIRRFAEHIVQTQQRQERTAQVAGAGAASRRTTG